MIELELIIDGKKKKFERSEMTIKDNIIAVKHQLKENRFWVSSEDPEKYSEISLSLLQTVVELFGKEFTIRDLESQPVSKIKDITNVYIKALGGEEESSTEDKKGKK